MAEAVLELGSNLFDRKENLDFAIKAIGMLLNTDIKEVSEFYETEPFGVPDKQDNYINCCIKLETELMPETLLGCCLGIEAAMGRKRTFKNAARIIDIDMLLYDDVHMNTRDLQLPHPRVFERAFVLVPLLDLYKGGRTPCFEFIEQLKQLGVSGVKKYAGKN